MQLIAGSAGISLAVLAFCIVMLGARNPRNPAWASPAWVGNCHSIIILMLGVGGIFSISAGIIKLTNHGIDLLSILISIAIFALTFLIVKAMKLKEKIARFEAMRHAN